MIKSFLCVGGLALGLQTAWGYALLGPNPGVLAGSGDAWQTLEIGYDLLYLNLRVPGGGNWLGDIGGPKNIGEEYRRNVPVLYYAYDASFGGPDDGFFGAEGEAAADQAFAIMNGLPDADSLDPSQFPFQSQTFNYQAMGAYLTDLKSVTLHLLVEQMGLTEPERYAWTLHERFTAAGPLPCPELQGYLVVQRNFDPTPSPLNRVQYSAYVNNVLYTYFIEEDCGHHPPDWSAITVPRPQDPSAGTYTAVAANNEAGSWTVSAIDPTENNQILFWSGGLQIGGFYTGLTSDDVGGLRYLMRTNNVNYEAPATGSILLSSTGGGTGLGPQFPLYTSNYTAFAAAALTNAPATLTNLFPGLVVISSTLSWVTVATPNVVVYYTNQVGSPLGAPTVLVVKTNGFTTNAVANYAYTFANLVIITNNFHTNTSAKLVTVTVSTPTGAPLGAPLVTNTTAKTINLTNVPSGTYYISTNPCGPDVIVSPQPPGFPIANVVATTNLIYAASNSLGYFTSQSIVTYATNYVIIVQSLICSATVAGGTAGPGFYQGIGQVQFQRVPDMQLDPLSHLFTSPLTNTYTMYLLNTNSQLMQQTFMRVVTAPDILFTTADLANGPGQNQFVGSVARSVPKYEIANALPNLAGPGVIDGQTTFTFNRVGAVFYNGPFPDTNGFTDLVNETTQIPALQWASFDDSTNAPILYPNTASIQELENQMVITISPTTLPDGANNAAYPTTQFSATGGSPPYFWSLGAGAPPGLTLSTDGELSGTPNGNAGPYDFTIQLTDSSGAATQSPGRVVTLNYTITIH
jgi:hypothetical protein